MFPSQILSELLSKGSVLLKAAGLGLAKENSRDLLIGNLILVQDSLQDVTNVLSKIMDLTFDGIDTVQFLKWIEEGKTYFYGFYHDVANIELSLIPLLDDVERELSGGIGDKKLSKLFDAIEVCSTKLDKLKQVLDSSKSIFDTALEFNEIFDDHVKSLDAIIASSMKRCTHIRNHGTDATVRQIPYLNLDQLTVLLTSNADTTETKVPTFSDLDRSIYEEYFKILKGLDPVEKSLREVLYSRIQDFQRRSVKTLNVSYILQRKYEELLRQQEQLKSELYLTKIELIDTRWDSLFTDLISKLSAGFTESKEMLSQLKNRETPSEGKEVILKKLRHTINAIDKGFDVLNGALEASILTSELAADAQNLAPQWIVLRKELELVASKDFKPATDLLPSLSRLSVEDKRDIDPNPHDTNKDLRAVGALLFRKMNIKPILIDHSPKSARKKNPIYCGRKFEKLEPTALSFSSIPKLAFEGKSINGKNNIHHISTDELEKERIVYYCKRQSRIPVIMKDHQKRLVPCARLLISKLHSPIMTNLNQSYFRLSPLRNRIPRPTPATALLAIASVDADM